MTAPKINLYPADLGGVGHNRIIWPGQHLAAQGADVDVILPEREEQIQAVWSPAGDLLDVVAPDCDVVVLQRPLTRVLAEGVTILQRKGLRVVVDVDDDFEAISPRNISWSHVQPHLRPEANKEWLRLACERADLVVCSTPALAARYGRHGRVRVVRNGVPERYLSIPRPEHEGLFVGWSGSLETHPDDLQVTGGGVARAVKASGATFAVIGTGRGVKAALGLAVAPLACGWRPIEEYPTAVAQLDVGIVPLELTAFNAAKSALKLLEMAALGVAVVASPTPENVAHQHLAMLAHSPREWEGKVKALLRDDGLRLACVASAREHIAGHTIEHRAQEWLDAWGSVVNTPKSPCAA